MNAVKQSVWLFLTLLSLACLGWYLASKPATLQFDQKTLDNTIDIVISNLVVSQYDDTGHLTHYLKTPLLQHIPLHATHVLTKPYILVTQDTKTPWEIQSKHAVALYNGKQITFSDEVSIHQNESSKTPASDLKTQELVYFPESKFATTSKKIIFTQQGSVITSMGMNAFLDENRVQLLNHAQGMYVPTHG